MFAALHSDINSLNSCLLHLTGKLNFKKGRSAKVKDEINLEIKFLGTISVDRYKYNDRGMTSLAKGILCGISFSVQNTLAYCIRSSMIRKACLENCRSMVQNPTAAKYKRFIIWSPLHSGKQTWLFSASQSFVNFLRKSWNQNNLNFSCPIQATRAWTITLFYMRNKFRTVLS